MGDIEDKGVFLGSILFASDPTKPYAFGCPCFDEKSSISLFIKIPVPVGIMPDPYAVLSVYVLLTALPHLSTIEK